MDYYGAPAPTSGTSYLPLILGVVVLLVIGFAFYNYTKKGTVFGTAGAEDKTPMPVNGKERTVITAAELPSTGGALAHGVQFWMYIADWDYKFGQTKQVLKRVMSGNTSVVNPSVTLHPTDNSLQVTVHVYPSNDEKTTASAPTTTSTGDSFTCTVENVPLQAWFSVSVTVFQRNMDIYLNGRLVKSCVLPGIPKPAVGDLILNDAGGFSGSLCNTHVYPQMLTPEDAQAFFRAGTTCAAPAPKESTLDTGSSLMSRLFGYAFRFTTFKDGKELNSYTL